MPDLVSRSCDMHWEFVYSLYTRFGSGEFTVAKCREAGIIPPRGMAWFRNRSVVRLVGRRQKSDGSAIWALSNDAIGYIENRLKKDVKKEE